MLAVLTVRVQVLRIVVVGCWVRARADRQWEYVEIVRKHLLLRAEKSGTIRGREGEAGIQTLRITHESTVREGRIACSKTQ
jgi:hypothetical protein